MSVGAFADQAMEAFGPHLSITYLGCGRIASYVRNGDSVDVTAAKVAERGDLIARYWDGLDALFQDQNDANPNVNVSAFVNVYRDEVDNDIRDSWGHLSVEGCRLVASRLEAIFTGP